MPDKRKTRQGQGAYSTGNRTVKHPCSSNLCSKYTCVGKAENYDDDDDNDPRDVDFVFTGNVTEADMFSTSPSRRRS